VKRFVAAGGAFAAAVGGILWFLLLMSTADTVIFSRNYPLLIALNVVLALGMLGLVGWQLRTLWRDYQAQVFGARLKLRLMLMFGVIAVLPGRWSMAFRCNSSPVRSKAGSTCGLKRP
jgi:nitrogen fixation/metabolism regulation signal transduction histidine kinase